MDTTTIELRRCITCGQEKPAADAYHRCPKGIGGLSRKCKACTSVYQAAYRARIKSEGQKAHPAVVVAVRPGGVDRCPRTACGLERESRDQDLAVFGADLARLRRALEAWWEESGGGEVTACGAAFLAARVALRSAAAQDARILRRRARA